jgi:hypothetical protein
VKIRILQAIGLVILFILGVMVFSIGAHETNSIEQPSPELSP